MPRWLLLGRRQRHADALGARAPLRPWCGGRRPPPQADPRSSPHARLVAAQLEPLPVRHGIVTLRFTALPHLPSFALVWDGALDRPCEGASFTLQRMPTGSHAQLRGMMLQRWEGECYALPSPLRFHDNRLFPAPEELLAQLAR